MGSLREGGDDWKEILAALGTLYTRGAAWIGPAWTETTRDTRGAADLSLSATALLVSTPACDSRCRVSRRCATLVASTRGGLWNVAHPLLGLRLRSGLPEIQFESMVGATQPSFLAAHVVHGITIFPATGYVEMALGAATAGLGWSTPVLEDVAIMEPFVLPLSGAESAPDNRESAQGWPCDLPHSQSGGRVRGVDVARDRHHLSVTWGTARGGANFNRIAQCLPGRSAG